MGSSSPDQSSHDADVKPSFRKPSGDAANRKYRRRSPAGSSSPSSGGSPKHGHSHSPDARRGDPARSSDGRHKKNNAERDSDKDPSRKWSEKSSSLYRYTDKQSYRSNENRRRDDYNGRYRHTEEDDRNSHRYASRSGRESGDGSRFSYSRHRNDYDKRDAEKRSRGELDEQGHRRDREREINLERDRQRDRDGGRDDRKDRKNVMGDQKYDSTSIHEEARVRSQDLALSGRSGSNRSKGTYGSSKEVNSQKEEESKNEGRDCDWHNERYKESESSGREKRSFSSFSKQVAKLDSSMDKNSNVNEDNEPLGKKMKSEKATGFSEGTSLSKFSTSAVEGKQDIQDSVAKMSVQQANTSASEVEVANDLNAAKVAAMKAAELVNRNLVGCGYLSTDQKKKLLWGSKKTTSVPEQSGNRWDMPLFSDKERQEKFNKLMSLRLPWYIWPIVGCERRCETGDVNQRQGPQRSHQRGATESASIGLGEAVYCRAPKKRWPDSRVGSVVTSITHNFFQNSDSWTEGILQFHVL